MFIAASWLACAPAVVPELLATPASRAGGPGIVFAVAEWQGRLVAAGAGVTLHRLADGERLSWHLPTPGVSRDLEALGGRLLVAERRFGDVPSHLRELALEEGSLREVAAAELPGEALRVAVAGGRAWVATGRAGLAVVGLDGGALEILPGQHVEGWISAVAAVGDRLYAADAKRGLRAFGITPGGLEELALPEGGVGSGRPHALAAGGGRLVLANDGLGVELFTLDERGAPRHAATLSTPGQAWGVDLEENLLAVAAGHAGAIVFELSGDAAARQLGSFEVPGFAWDVELAAGRLYVAAGDSGLLGFDLPRWPVGPRRLGRLASRCRPLPGEAIPANEVK